MRPGKGDGALGRLLRRVGWRRHRPVRLATPAMKMGLGIGLYYSGALTRWRRRRRSRGSPIILMYHSVGGHGLSPDLVVSPARFEAHIRYLLRHYRIVSFADAVKLLEAGRPLPNHAVVVTLDDGYRDNYDEAFPILRRYGCPATIFVTVEPVETGHLPWPQALWHALNATQRSELRISWRSAHGAAIETVLPLRTGPDREGARTALKLFAGGLAVAERWAFLSMITRDLGVASTFDARAMLTWNQLREMSRSGIAVGGHTMTHPQLPGLDEDTRRHELVECRRRLSEELATEITLFAYPFGGPESLDESCKRAVIEAGYTAGCSAMVGARNAPVDLRALDRIYVPDEPTWTFALRLLQLETESRLIAWALRPR